MCRRRFREREVQEVETIFKVRNAHHPFQIEQECDRALRRCSATYWLFLKSNRAAYEPEEHLQGAGAVRLPLVIRRATSASRQLLSRR